MLLLNVWMNNHDHDDRELKVPEYVDLFTKQTNDYFLIDSKHMMTIVLMMQESLYGLSVS